MTQQELLHRLEVQQAVQEWVDNFMSTYSISPSLMEGIFTVVLGKSQSKSMCK